MNNKVYIALIVLLGLLCAFLGYKVSQKTETIVVQETQIEELGEDRSRLELDLEKMAFSYDTLMLDNQALSGELLAERSRIEDLLKKVKNKDYDLYKIKKEASTLRDIMKGYVHTIDSLNTLNKEQMVQIEGLQGDLTEVSKQKNALEEEKQALTGKIQQGSVLQAGGVASLGIREKNSGKQVETDRASRTEMIKTCFVLRKNTLAEPGDKNLYIRIIAPNGQVLPANGSSTGTFDGQVGSYSIKRVVNYQNAETDLCVYYMVPNPDNLEKGNYTVFIYEEDKRIGQTTLALR